MSGEKSVARMEFPTGDKLAFERTRLAYERTLMAWIRTATALIAFGFAMYKLFEFMPFVTGLKPGEHLISPRGFAIVLATLGNLALLVATIQHRMNLQAMRALGIRVPLSTAAILSVLLSLLGIGVLVIVIMHL